jgi:hypothetical protein
MQERVSTEQIFHKKNTQKKLHNIDSFEKGYPPFIGTNLLLRKNIGSRSLQKKFNKSNPQNTNAAMGIRTPVAGVKGPHDWPDYTIAALCSI